MPSLLSIVTQRVISLSEVLVCKGSSQSVVDVVPGNAHIIFKIIIESAIKLSSPQEYTNKHHFRVTRIEAILKKISMGKA